MTKKQKDRPTIGVTKLAAERDRLIADYEWLRRMMRLLEMQTELVDRQLVELEGLLPDDYAPQAVTGSKM